MVQDVLADDGCAAQLTDADRRGLTPLFWTHVALLLPVAVERLRTGRGWTDRRNQAAFLGVAEQLRGPPDQDPAWLADPALADAWIALPPARGYRQAQPDTGVIAVDRRVAALHLLISQAANGPDPTGVPRDAVTRILEWFAGPHAVH